MVFGQTSPVEHLNQDENTVERIRCNLGERFVFHYVFPGNDHISPTKEFLKMSFLFPRWDMLLPLPRYLKGGHVTTFHRFRVQAHVIDVDIKHWLPKR